MKNNASSVSHAANQENRDGESRDWQTHDREGLVQRTFFMVDRGPRPATRGWFHSAAAILMLAAASVLTTFSWMRLEWWQALGATVYGCGLIALFAVSALYHRIPWAKQKTVQAWRRADHAMIAVFIAATYTPFCLIVLPQAWWLLAIVWGGAITSAVMKFFWLSRPRWVDVAIYVTLGWLIVPLVSQLWTNAGPAVVWLLLAGGVVYTVGAVAYGLKWPGRNARVYGYHEHFHTATIIAAIFHLVAVWIIVASA